MDFNYLSDLVFACFVFLLYCDGSSAQYYQRPRPKYGNAVNVYKPVYFGGGGGGGAKPLSHNSLHTPLSGGGGYKFGSRLPIVQFGKGYQKNAYPKSYQKPIKAIKAESKTIVNSKTNVNIKKEQPVTVVFNRPKPVIVLDRRPVINIIKNVERPAKKKQIIKQNIDLIGTVGQATGQKTIDVNAGGATVGMRGGVAVGGGANVKGASFNVDIINKFPAGVFQRPGMVEAAKAMSSGPNMFADVGVAQMGQNIGIGGIGPIDMGAIDIGRGALGLSPPEALALTSAVARLEDKISKFQQNVNINNNNNNNNQNNNANNNVNNHVTDNNGFDMDQIMMAMMLNGGELSDTMVESMTRKLTGGGGSGAGVGSTGSGSGSGGGTSIHFKPSNSTGKSVVLKVDGNVQISKSSLLGQ